MKKFDGDQTKWRLCLGCGACTDANHNSGRELYDFLEEGIRPLSKNSHNSIPTAYQEACPLIQTDFGSINFNNIPNSTLKQEWGQVLEIWEGHATNPDIRFKGASGGVLTALSAFVIEKLGMRGVLHTGQDPEDPVRNRTRLSRNTSELMAAVGSRYSPASVCNGLNLVAETGGPCAVVGRPVEIAAIRNQERLSPERVQNVDALFSFFCAESPATQGTLDLLQLMGIKTDQIDGLDYRGNGWPGHFAPHSKTAPEPLPRKTYRESWSFLQAYRPWASHIWPDGTGELADISCGDPWYHEPDNKNPGSSLVVVRTEKGRDILRGAIKAGYLELKPAEAWKLAKSQEGLVRKKGAVWGRLLVMRMMGLPSPYYQNAHLFACWRKLSLEEKLRSTIGTARRIIMRKLYRPLRMRPEDGLPVKPAMLGSGTKED